MEVIWRFHWDALGCHSWAPNKLHCWISAPHMEALWEGVFSSSWGESCATILLSVSLILFLFLCFFFDFFFLGEFVLVTVFCDFHWKPGCDYMVQHSGLLWMARDRQPVYSMEEDKKSFLCVFICLSQRFWHLLAISCDLSCLCIIMN